MNLFYRELALHRFQIILWSIIISLSYIALMALFPFISNNAETFKDLLSTIPSTSIEAIGINTETFFTPIGYYTFIFQIIILLGAFEASIIGISSLLNDRVHGSSSDILIRPISRKKIFVIKYLASVVALLITNIIYMLTSTIIMMLLHSTNGYTLFLINLALFFIQIVFLSISFMCAQFISKTKALHLTAMGIILFFYAVSIIENIVHNSILRYLNPFSYFKALDILEYGGYMQSFIIASIFITFFTVSFSYHSYKEKDVMR